MYTFCVRCSSIRFSWGWNKEGNEAERMDQSKWDRSPCCRVLMYSDVCLFTGFEKETCPFLLFIYLFFVLISFRTRFSLVIVKNGCMDFFLGLYIKLVLFYFEPLFVWSWKERKLLPKQSGKECKLWTKQKILWLGKNSKLKRICDAIFVLNDCDRG